MPLVTHSTVPAISASSARKPNRFMRMVHAVVEARTRMYLQAVTDPETGRIDPGSRAKGLAPDDAVSRSAREQASKSSGSAASAKMAAASANLPEGLIGGGGSA